MSTHPEELTPQEESRPTSLDATLRPAHWDDYIGQSRVKENVRILLTAAKQRGQAPEHVLFYGPPGLGKTTLAHLIAKELNSQMKITSGPAIERVGDLAAILTNLAEGDILFIDEIHRLNKSIEEVLYPALESGVLDIIIGKGPSARTLQIDLAPFTLVAATTQASRISAPLRSRFSGGVFHLKYYSEDELVAILKRSAKLLAVEAEEMALRSLARRSRGTPRIANYLLKRARDYAQVHERVLDTEAVEEALALLDIDALGLTDRDRELLRVLDEHFGGGPVGLNTLAAALSEEEATLAEVHEPYLLQIGLLKRTPRGRELTDKGKDYLQKHANE